MSLVSTSINAAFNSVTLTFSRPVVAGTLGLSGIRATGANAVTRNSGSGAYAGGLTVTRTVTGVGTPTAPLTCSWVGGAVPFTDTDGNVCPSWTGRPCPIV